MTQDSTRLFLLRAIQMKGNIQPLVELGYDYSQIVMLINNEIGDGNAAYVENVLTITPKGVEIIKELKENFQKTGSNNWIEPEFVSKTNQISIDFIFLPERNEFSFLSK